MPADRALVAILLGLAGFFLLATAALWVKVGRDREAPSEIPSIPVHAFRTAANATAVTFGLLGVALLVVVLTALR